MQISSVATKTITLELDAYERLCSFKRPGESFSEVVRRAIFPDCPPKGIDLLNYYNAGGSCVPDSYLDAVEQADKSDKSPDNSWG